MPHPLDLPKGCKFAPRCKYATDRCLEEEAKLEQAEGDRLVRCFYPEKEVRHVKDHVLWPFAHGDGSRVCQRDS